MWSFAFFEMLSYTVSSSSRTSWMASISTGFKPRANESGSSGSFSLRVPVLSFFCGAMCFLGCPCSTNLDIEKAVDLTVAFVPRVAARYSSRIWCNTFLTVFPTECSWKYHRISYLTTFIWTGHAYLWAVLPPTFAPHIEWSTLAVRDWRIGLSLWLVVAPAKSQAQ